MEYRCKREGCTDVATHIPRLCVPNGRPQPIMMCLGVPLCLVHCMEFDTRQQFGDIDGEPSKIRQIFVMMNPNKMHYPDFNSAYTEAEPITSPMAQAVLRPDARYH